MHIKRGSILAQYLFDMPKNNYTFYVGKTPDYAKSNSDVYVYIYNEDTGVTQGYVCFQNLDFKSGLATVAYKTYPPYRGNGIMKQNLSKAIDFVFNNLFVEELEADVHIDNAQSIHLLKVHNFTFQKKFAKRGLDYYSFSLRKGDFLGSDKTLAKSELKGEEVDFAKELQRKSFGEIFPYRKNKIALGS